MATLPTHSEVLSQSHCQASLAEHFEFQLRLQRYNAPLASEIVKFSGLDDVDLAMKQLRFPVYELPNVHRALRRSFRAWRLEFEGGEQYTYRRVLWSPVYRRVEVRPGKFASYLFCGSQFYTLPGGSRRVLLWDEADADPPQLECTLIGPRPEATDLKRETAALARSAKRHHYLRGQALRADATLLGKKQRANWGDIVLDPHVRRVLEENTIGLLRERKRFKLNGIPQRRGVLLYGPPGTGKTMIGKALSQLPGVTFVWATAADFAQLSSLRGVFALARSLKPSIVFLEDLDLYASERGGCSSVTLGEMLSQMDGLEENDGLIVVATTNDLAAIEPALRDRPSRFDVVLEIGLPDETARRGILAKNLVRQLPDSAVLDAAAHATAGLTGAQVREVAFLAVQSAMLRAPRDSNHVAQLSQGDVQAAVERLTGKRPIGFATL